MITRFPSGVAWTEVGYHPVGMNPATRLRPLCETSITQTLLLSALATKSVFWSPVRAIAFGVDPEGAFGERPVFTDSIGRPDSESITVTSSELPQETKS